MELSRIAREVAQATWLPFLCLLAITPILLQLPITHDAIWQMWVGRQMLHGEVLYRDIIEVNPPLWFWTAVPIAAVGEAFHIGARALIILFFVATMALSLWLSPRRYRLLLLVVFTLVPLQDFGQREHFTLMAAAPYVFLVAARAEGRPPRHAIAIGFFAAFGFALKPHFALVPLALEALVWKKPRFRPETIVLLVAALAYVGATLLFASAYFTDMLPMLREAYGAFPGPANFRLLLLTFGIGAVGAVLGRRSGSAETRALAVSAVTFLTIALIQQKGFSYHSIPARGFLLVAIAVEIMNMRRRPIADAFLAASALLCFWPIGTYHNDYRTEIEQHLAGVKPGTSVILLSMNASAAWPMVDEHQLTWKLRQFHLWQVGAITEGNLSPDSRLRRIVAEDLSARPEILIIDHRPRLGPATQSLIPQGYLDQYSERLRTPRFESYVLRAQP